MREMGVNQNFQPPRKNGVVWPNYTPCRRFEIRLPPPVRGFVEEKSAIFSFFVLPHLLIAQSLTISMFETDLNYFPWRPLPHMPCRFRAAPYFLFFGMRCCAQIQSALLHGKQMLCVC